MKIFAFAFAILMAGASAVPSDVETKINERFIEGIIENIFADVSQGIQEAGLDPLYILHFNEIYRLPVTNLVNVEVLVDDLASHGLSNIVINHANYGILTSILQLDVSLPGIYFSAKTAKVDALLMGWSFNAGVSGSFAIIEPRVYADVKISIGIISGISISSLEVDLSLGGIQSNLNVNIQGTDYSDAINNFAGVTLPNALAENKDEINELVAYILRLVLDEIL